MHGRRVLGVRCSTFKLLLFQPNLVTHKGWQTDGWDLPALWFLG
jgi:hypothetical protein